MFLRELFKCIGPLVLISYNGRIQITSEYEIWVYTLNRSSTVILLIKKRGTDRESILDDLGNGLGASKLKRAAYSLKIINHPCHVP